jgi:hypothetical protein
MVESAKVMAISLDALLRGARAEGHHHHHHG